MAKARVVPNNWFVLVLLGAIQPIYVKPKRTVKRFEGKGCTATTGSGSENVTRDEICKPLTVEGVSHEYVVEALTRKCRRVNRHEASPVRETHSGTLLSQCL
jgi:hypothetical protein